MAGFLQTSWSGVEPPFEFTDITTNFDYPGAAQIFVQEQSGYFSSIELFLVKFDGDFDVNSTATAYIVGLDISEKPNISDIKCQSDPLNLISLDIPNYSILDEELSRKRFIFSSSSHLTAGTKYAIILSFNYAASDPAVYINAHTGGVSQGILFPYGGTWYPNGDGSTLRYRLVGNTEVITYTTVTFHENPTFPSTSGSVPAPQTNPSEYPLDIYLTNCDLLKTGYSFTGWNTVADGSGTHYANAALIVPWFPSNIDLYAQWEEIILATLTFDGNGSDYGDVPPPVSYNAGQSPPEPIPSYQTNSLGKIGCMFDGWAETEGGGGNVYRNNEYIDPWLSSNTTVYAQWGCGYISVIYDGNGEDSGKVPSPTSLPAGSTFPLSENINNLAKTGYVLLGWNTRADGTGTTYYFGDYITWFTETTTVYALWATNATVTYDGTGTSGYLDPTTAIAGDPAGRYLRSTFESTPPYEKSGYIFAGWNTAIDNSGDAYDDNEFIGPWFTTDKTLYAQWAVVGSQVTVTYNGNGSDQGTVPSSQTYNAGNAGQVLLNPFTSGNLAKTGHFFHSWNTKADGSGKIYSDLQFMPRWFYFSLTLYAQWKPNVTLWSSLEIPEPKTALSVALVGTKLLFAGGSIDSAGYGPVSDKVYVYDIVSNSWRQLAQNLSSARYLMASATVGSKVIFAAGLTATKAVDIYDFANPENPTWLLTEIPVSARWAMSSAVVGNKAIFAGGYDGLSDLPEVCVYDVSTGGWTTITPLTIGRSFMTSSVITTGAHTLVMFAGGYIQGGFSYSDVIDVYDFTNPESPVLLDPETSPIPIPSALSGKRAHLASAVIGNMIIFAGGETSSIGFSSRVEIFDMSTGNFLPVIQVPQLSLARSTLVPAVVGNLVLFAGGLARVNPHTTRAEGTDVIDIYDFTNPQYPTKTTSVLPMGPRSYLASAVFDPSLAVKDGTFSLPQSMAFFAGGCRGDIYESSVASIDIYSTGEIIPPEPLPPGYELFTFDNMKFDFYIQENIDFSELSKVAEIVDLTKL